MGKETSQEAALVLQAREHGGHGDEEKVNRFMISLRVRIDVSWPIMRMRM